MHKCKKVQYIISSIVWKKKKKPKEKEEKKNTIMAEIDCAMTRDIMVLRPWTLDTGAGSRLWRPNS